MLNRDLDYIIAIPARIGSTRLEKKILQDIGGKSMIERVLEQCSKCKNHSQIVVFTDSHEVYNLTLKKGYQSIITKDNYISGSERIASNIKNINSINNIESTYIVNVQADQPTINPILIDQVMDYGGNDYLKDSVLTPIFKIDKSKVDDPNIVKVVINERKDAMYFSRSVIPHIRDKNNTDKYSDLYLGHIGIYGYRANILLKWNELTKSQLEEAEALEQLRLLESGIRVATFLTNIPPDSIDTYEQLESIRKNF